MHPDLELHRTVMIKKYRSYLAADRAWAQASQEVHAWFPERNSHGIATVGNPGSPVRRLYERREEALRLMMAARLKLEEAKKRLAKKSSAPIALIPDRRALRR